MTVSRTDRDTRAPAELAKARAEIANLEAALRTNRTIGTAVGILIERHKLSADAAFALLVELSQHTNRKLRDVAADLVYTGEIPSIARGAEILGASAADRPTM